MNMNVATGKAKITRFGILFLDCYYASTHKFSRSSVERDLSLEGVELDVIYDPTDLSKILIMPIGPNGEFDVAERLTSVKRMSWNLWLHVHLPNSKKRGLRNE